MENNIKNFESLVVNSIPRLMRYALTLYPNKMDAEDLTQETILRMLDKRKQFDGKNFIGWSCVVMRSIFLCQRKAATIRRTDDIDECVSVMSNESTDTRCNMESVFGYLSEPHRKCMELVADGYQYNEIAEMLCIPIGTVKSRISMARRKISHIDGVMRF